MTVVIDPETGVSVTYGIFDGRYRVDVNGAVLADTADFRFNLPDDPLFWMIALLTGETAREGEREATYQTYPGVSARLLDDLTSDLIESDGDAA